MKDGVFFIISVIMFFVVFCLCGCNHKTPVQQGFDDVRAHLISISQSLPPECKTADVESKITLARADMLKTQLACENKIQEYKSKHNATLSVLFGGILLFFIYFLIKR